MPNLDDERFEAYLKQFRPVVAEPLEMTRNRRATRRTFVFAAGVAAAVALLMAIALTMHPHRQRTPAPQAAMISVAVEQSTNQRPLTIRSANESLAHASSFRVALDDMAFRSRPAHLPSGTQSVLAVLSKENIKQ